MDKPEALKIRRVFLKHLSDHPETPVFGQIGRRSCDLVDSRTCNASGEGDFGQLHNDSRKLPTSRFALRLLAHNFRLDVIQA